MLRARRQWYLGFDLGARQGHERHGRVVEFVALLDGQDREGVGRLGEGRRPQLYLAKGLFARKDDLGAMLHSTEPKRG